MWNRGPCVHYNRNLSSHTHTQGPTSSIKWLCNNSHNCMCVLFTKLENTRNKILCMSECTDERTWDIRKRFCLSWWISFSYISQFNCIHYNTVECAWAKKLPFPVARTLHGTDLPENSLLALRTSDSRADFPTGVCFRLLEQQPA